MQKLPLLAVIVGILLAPVALSGCESSSQPQVADASITRGIDRDAAIASARQDAWGTYRELAVAQIAAQRVGDFWVVELRAASGSGLRYVISSHDGSIRQRSTIE